MLAKRRIDLAGRFRQVSDRRASTVIVPSIPGGRIYADVGNGASTSFVVEHNLNTRDVIVSVHRNVSPWETVAVTVERTTLDTVTVKFGAAPAANEFRVIVSA